MNSRTLLVTALLLLSQGATADITDMQRAEILDVSTQFSAAVLQGRAIEYSISTLYMPFARAAAPAYGFSSASDLQDAMRQGYAYSTSIVEVVAHDLHPDLASFGEAGNWTWGIVPFSVQSQYRDKDDPIPPSCNGLLVFGQDGIWFTHTLSDRADAFLMTTIPEFGFLDAVDVDCVLASS